MASAARAGLLGLALCVGLAACGGGDGDGEPGLSIRAQWQASGRLEPQCIGQELPAAAQRIRVTIRSDDGRYQCCIGLDPDDPALADRSVVLTGLPTGPVTVGLDAYPNAPVPSDGIATTCLLREGSGAACVDTPCSWPSFAAAPASVTLARGEQSRVEMCAQAQPFLLADPSLPPCDGAIDANPVPVLLVVGNAEGATDARVRIVQSGNPPPPPCDPTPPATPSVSEVIRTSSCICGRPTVPCGGDGEPPCCETAQDQTIRAACSHCDELEVSCRVLLGAAFRLGAGCANLELVGADAVLAFPFSVGSNPPTPTPSATLAPTETPTVTPSPSATPTPTETGTPTESPSPSGTFFP